MASNQRLPTPTNRAAQTSQNTAASSQYHYRQRQRHQPLRLGRYDRGTMADLATAAPNRPRAAITNRPSIPTSEANQS
jgi:hypothetical protein